MVSAIVTQGLPCVKGAVSLLTEGLSSSQALNTSHQNTHHLPPLYKGRCPQSGSEGLSFPRPNTNPPHKTNVRNFALNQWAKFRGTAVKSPEKQRRKLIPMLYGVNFRHPSAVRPKLQSNFRDATPCVAGCRLSLLGIRIGRRGASACCRPRSRCQDRIFPPIRSRRNRCGACRRIRLRWQ